MFYSCVSARTVLTTREALIFTCSSVTAPLSIPCSRLSSSPLLPGIGKMRLCAKWENRGGRPPFCGGTTPNNLSVNSENVLAGWAAIRQINLPAGKKSNMSAPFCSFTKGREKEYNLNNRHRKYTVRQDRNAQYQLMQGDCHIWRVSCIGSRNGDLP